MRTRPRAVVGWALVAIGVASVGSLSSADEARALPPVPVGPLGPAIGVGVDAITGGLGGAAVDGFSALLGKLFSWPAEVINRHLLAWLVAVPDYAISPRSTSSGRAGSNLAELASTTSAMAFALLAAVGTVAGLRYWAAGLSGSGGFDALEGLARTVGAALFVVAWPWLFRHAADLSNAAARGLLGSGSVLEDTSRLLGQAFVSAVSLNFFAIVIACAAGLLFLALLMCKIVASASTALVFTAMPLAAALWVIPELEWVARAAMRAFAVVLVIPVAWALCFATFAAVGMDALELKGAGSLADSLIMPLVALALLWVMLALPRSLARMAMLGGFARGGFGARTASYVAARRTDAAISQGVPSSFGGKRGSGASDVPDPASPGAGARGQRPTGAAVAGSAAATAVGGPVGAAAAAGARGAGAGTAAGGRGASAAAAASSTSPASTGSATPVPSARSPRADSSAPAPVNRGLRAPSWQEIRERVPAEAEAAAARRDSTTRADVAAAMRDLDPETQSALQRLADAKKGRIGGEMVHQAARSDIGEGERDAFRTLAAATPQVRTQGIADFFADTQASSAVTAPGDATRSGDPGPLAASGPMGAPAPAAPPAQPAPPSADDSRPADGSAAL
ncbi:hypothetical protein [Solirubrobacter soli]|uniref:hypothetical protein n=1 Tax=Solirubrobacter soli TaxID=363832 RepID=UPI0004210448|nr:hypothetical protein [Solirubrobacter soli]